MFDLTGKAAVVTGAGTGIGKAIALLLAKRGAAVTVVARREAMLNEVAEEIRSAGGKALVVAGDVADPELPTRVMRMTAEKFGSVDILVNNAGISDRNFSVKNCTDEMWDENISVNQTAQFRFCREALLHMEPKRAGRIVNVSSIGGVYSMAGVSYSSAKMAVIGLTKNIAMQYTGKGIRCNAICPGPTLTDMIKPDDSKQIDTELESITCRRLDPEAGPSMPEDMAAVVLFLVSDEACGINGQIIVIDRGLCL